MATHHGEYQQWQPNVDYPDSGQKPTPVVCFRYHRQCPACLVHELDGLIEEIPKGEHRGKIQCASCHQIIPGYYIWDCTSKTVIGRVRHDLDREACPVEWAITWLQSIEHLVKEE